MGGKTHGGEAVGTLDSTGTSSGGKSRANYSNKPTVRAGLPMGQKEKAGPPYYKVKYERLPHQDS